MVKKLTRRLMMGTILAGLGTGPFLIYSCRPKKQLPEGPESPLNLFREEFRESLTFPLEFKEYIHPQLADKSPSEIREVIEMHKRQWRNWVSIKEIEFDYLFQLFDKNGEPIYHNFCINAHVVLKYGKGMEIHGTRLDTNEKIDWFIDLDGNINNEAFEEMNFVSMAHSFFDAYTWFPNSCFFSGVHARNVSLPENPFLTSDDKYDVFNHSRDKAIPVRVQKVTYCRYYVNKRTGMTDLIVSHFIHDMFSTKYQDDSIPIPPRYFNYSTYKYTIIDNTSIPVEIVHYYPDSKQVCMRWQYTNIKIKK